jgi:hypothetical protein
MKSLILSVFLACSTGLMAASVFEGHFVEDSSKISLNFLKTQTELTIDHLNSRGYEVYGPKGTGEYLKQLQLTSYPLQKHHNKSLGGYPSVDEIFNQLKVLEKKYPKILQLTSIGLSHNGRELYVMKISDNVSSDEIEPEVKYIANMHGDEIVGRELMVLLIADLAKGYGIDKKITKLINNTEIFIMPTMNPDGSQASTRGNAKFSDLNRNFPDFTTSDNRNVSSGRQPETMAIMDWQATRQIAFSANFHGGAEVVNYPWDTKKDDFPFLDMVIKISQDYSNLVPGMRSSTAFPGGITNGYAWYEVDGGMQDWSYYWHNDLQITVELSDIKWPSYKAVAGYYADNSSSLIHYLETVHQGAGFSTSRSTSGSVEIFALKSGNKISRGTYSFFNGEFFKVLPTGKYQFQVDMNNTKKSFNVDVKSSVSSNGNYTTL